MTYRLSLSNQKGGVGKTTITINVAGALAERGHDVLLVDMDPQGHATEGLGLTDAYDAEPPSLYDILLDTDNQEVINDIVEPHAEFDVLPSNVDMFNAEPELTTAMRSRERFDMALDELDHDYDFLLVDCPPSLGNLTDNALLATQRVLIPALAEGTSIRALEILFDQIDTLEANYEVDIEDVGLVANRVEQDGEADDMMDWFERTFEGRVPVWEVRKRVALKRAWNQGHSIFAHDEECDMEAVFLDIADHLEANAEATA
ncbi:ParA family protein [Halocalculus aciditolerans]|uniref:Chromosome partitioning protein ParA n=1 Tax=Halocalculus aciditolerans TaxID=1383812 RepID=A0A830FET5_9EURY|nr:ParA family protein [Halocalculus aciditolerans]GGL67672.1 chromosome partitioning protein ParA [Halocalculus aciditolerans]